MLLKSYDQFSNDRFSEIPLADLGHDLEALAAYLDQSKLAINCSIWKMPEFELLYANDQFKDLYGLNDHDYIAWGANAAAHCLHGDQTLVFEEMLQKVYHDHTGETSFIKIKLSSEREVWRLVQIQPMKAADKLAILSVNVDHFDQIEAFIAHQKELFEYQQKYFKSYIALSSREKEVLSLLLNGASNQEVASALFISVETVKQHLKRIRVKTGLSSLVDLMFFAQAFEIY